MIQRGDLEIRGHNRVRTYGPYAEVSIGDENLGTRFAPAVDYFGFGRETRFRIYIPQSVNDPRPNMRNIAPTVNGDRLEWRDPVGDIGLNIYDHPNRPEYERGASEFEIVLGSRPPADILHVPFELDNITAIFQPQLTPADVTPLEMSLPGFGRPDHIVNSYALRATSRNGVMNTSTESDKYQTGKVGHLERAFLVDANGTRFWVDYILDLNFNEILFMIPPASVFPVTIGPTFGYTTIGGTGGSANQPNAGYATPASSGTLTSITVYTPDAATGWNIAAALYSDNAGDIDAKLVEDSGNTAKSGGADWYTVNMNSYSLVGSTQYWVTHWWDATHTYRYDTGAANQNKTESGETFETWPDPFVDAFSLARNPSLYGTYSASGGIPLFQHHYNQMRSNSVLAPVVGLEWLRRRKNKIRGSK